MVSDLCKYKNALGEPGKGFREVRLFNLSVVDVVATVLLGVILAKMVGTTAEIGVVGAFVLSVIFHKMFCVETTITKFFKF
jgi:hypothetical protein